MPFEPYGGYRWEIPPGIKVKKSIQDKFKTLETFFPCIVIHKLKHFINGTSYKFNNLPFAIQTNLITGEPIQSWTPPTSVLESIQQSQLREINEWKIVKSIYMRLFKFRKFLKGLIHRWRIGKCIKNIKNTEDPVTLDIPKHLVQVLDFPRRLSYAFEASSLMKTIEARIILSEYMFPNPLPPINPFTNEAFTRGQLISIIVQCRKKGKFSWILDRLYNSECDLILFTQRFRQPLKIMAIENHFKGCISKFMEEVVDFFRVEAERDELPESKMALFIDRIALRPNCEYVREWINLTRDFYIARELHDLHMLANIGIRSSEAIVRAYYLLS